MPKSVKILPELLATAGLTNGAFTVNPNFGRDRLGVDRGWQTYRSYSEKELGKKLDDIHLAEAPEVFNDALAWVGQRVAKSERFFLYLHTMDLHAPIKVERKYSYRYRPRPYTGILGPAVEWEEHMDVRRRVIEAGPDDLAWIQALSDGKLTWYDEVFGTFVAKLKHLGVLDSTLFVYTSDHGEHQGEREIVGHGISVYDGLARIPLVFRLPWRINQGSVFAEPVEPADVLPTLVDLLGITDVEPRDGTSLMPLLDYGFSRPMPYAVIETNPIRVSQWRSRSRAVRVGRFKLVVEIDEKPRVELYDIQSDPNERFNVAATRPIARRLCEILMTEAIATPTKSERGPERSQTATIEPQTEDAPIDADFLEELKVLGYVAN